MVPELEYWDPSYEQGHRGKKKSIWRFLEKSLQLHKAPVIERLVIGLGPECPIDADIGKWIAYAVDRRVRHLRLSLCWLSEPTSCLPKSIYICDTLVFLDISDKIFLDVPSTVCLPSLKSLCLVDVVYKDDDSLFRLLSGCPILKYLFVERHDHRDNLTNIIVKVPYLKTFCYIYKGVNTGSGGSMVIDCATLTKIYLGDHSGYVNSYSIENKPPLDTASIHTPFCSCDDMFVRSLSSVIHLNLALSSDTVACCKAIDFSQLIECRIQPCQLDWMEPFMCFLHNSPKLKVLHIDQLDIKRMDFPVSFNRPSSVPECLSTHLKIFDWKEYVGRKEEKEFVGYILANSKCLKTAGISIETSYNPEKQKAMMKELESMSRLSTSSQLLFSTQAKLEFLVNPLNEFFMSTV